jgi:hypothetical protein
MRLFPGEFYGSLGRIGGLRNVVRLLGAPPLAATDQTIAIFDDSFSIDITRAK